MRNGLRFFVALAVLSCATTFASPVHVLRFFAPGRQQNCDQALWVNNLVFFNGNPTAAEVHILGVANGIPVLTDPSVIVIPPGRAVSANGVLRGAWTPAPVDDKVKLWIMHLDVPDGVVIESRDELINGYPCIFQIPAPPESLGKVSLPIFRDAVPPNTLQTFLGSDVGSRSARINVGVYNAGNVLASAHIEVRRVCDSGLTDARDIVIPADTVVQTNGLTTGSALCSSGQFDFMRYTTVTVDQPSMVYVVALTETPIHVLPGTAPDVGMTVPLSSSR